MPMPKDNLFCAFRGGLIYWENLIDYAEQGIECRLNSIAAVDSSVAMQDLLQYLGIGNQSLALADQLFEQPLRVAFVGMVSAHQVHRIVRIDQNQDYGPVPYPFSISASMVSMSPVG